ncbi:hypothetical protein JCM21714_1236 [Gracilibacillus boraciitolerans JCM 21714]|uniref:Uncharacterized protein n=1 Tax=Gracilibacillus boraciitolerans JCM 21714 TaxID=1298598 RepID=W4VHL5_9BACI|nr:hypothetical protein [Gracilibacillus boraciitolerans]GAE92249.1 hypothetical protein JCM21714_1236 [Gracilibacillus boraciitolerans JCM 21714]
MRLYDAKYNQTCKICNFTISHNKQGRFTLHLKIQHHISLNEYLISYYYSSDELNCSYELCENKVKLYRGKPKKFCSNACASRNKAKPNICHVCGKKFDTTVRPHRATKTCSKYCENQLRSNSTYNWHKSMSKQQKDEHFTKIISKTAMTRKKNHTPSWNSGKTGIYSQEVIKKIRKSTLKQMENKVFRKTKIEILMEVFLKEFKIAYTYSFILENRQFDFYLKDYNILIECDGGLLACTQNFIQIQQTGSLKE